MRRDEQAILEIAKQIMKDSPGTTPEKALRHAKDIYAKRRDYKVSSEQKVTDSSKTPWNELPEYVRVNIKRQKKAEKIREKARRKLPNTRFVRGGKVSPK